MLKNCSAEIRAIQLVNDKSIAQFTLFCVTSKSVVYKGEVLFSYLKDASLITF